MRIIYWETGTGRSPVFDFMESQPPTDRSDIQKRIDFLEEQGYGLLGTHLKKLHPYDLFELRISCKTVIYRILIAIKNSSAWLLHGFIKKTQATQTREIQTALRRKNILESSQQWLSS